MLQIRFDLLQHLNSHVLKLVDYLIDNQGGQRRVVCGTTKIEEFLDPQDAIDCNSFL